MTFQQPQFAMREGEIAGLLAVGMAMSIAAVLLAGFVVGWKLGRMVRGA